jgi:beta-barrel assembly-enhancing protease
MNLRAAKCLLVSCLLLLIGGCASTAIQTDKKAETYTLAQEIQIGDELASGLLGAGSLHPNQAAQRYVNQVGRWIASQSPRPTLPWTFGVINSEHINAFAMPGGRIFITWGLLSRLNSEAELAGVLAHEIGHVMGQHHLKAFEDQQKNAKTGELLASSAQALLSLKTGRNAEVVKATGRVLVPLVKDAAKQLYVKGLDRDVEFQADRHAAVLLARSGYDPMGIVNVMQVLQAASGDSKFFELLGSTHPNPSSRLAALEQIMPTVIAANPNAREIGRDRFYQSTGISAPRGIEPVSQPVSQPVTQPAVTQPAPATTSPAPKRPVTKKK